MRLLVSSFPGSRGNCPLFNLRTVDFELIGIAEISVLLSYSGGISSAVVHDPYTLNSCGADKPVEPKVLNIWPEKCTSSCELSYLAMPGFNALAEHNSEYEFQRANPDGARL